MSDKKQWGTKDKPDRKVKVEVGGREVPEQPTFKIVSTRIRVDGIEIKTPRDIKPSEN